MVILIKHTQISNILPSHLTKTVVPPNPHQPRSLFTNEVLLWTCNRINFAWIRQRTNRVRYQRFLCCQLRFDEMKCSRRRRYMADVYICHQNIISSHLSSISKYVRISSCYFCSNKTTVFFENKLNTHSTHTHQTCSAHRFALARKLTLTVISTACSPFGRTTAPPPRNIHRTRVRCGNNHQHSVSEVIALWVCIGPPHIPTFHHR